MSARTDLNDIIDAAVTDKPAGTVQRDETGAAMKAIADYADSLLPYKSLVFTITQTGTSAPTATYQFNNFGATPVLARTTLGTYSLTLTGAFPTASKFWSNPRELVTASDGTNNARGLDAYRQSADVFLINTYVNDAAADVVLNNTCFEIRVYP